MIRRPCVAGAVSVAALLAAAFCAAEEPRPAAKDGELAAIEALAKAGRIGEALARLDPFLAGLPPQGKMVAWQHKAKRGLIRQAWPVGRYVGFAANYGRSLCALDAVTGRQTPAEATLLPFSNTVLPAADAGHVLVTAGPEVVQVDLETGAAVRKLRYKLDPRIGPVPFEGGFVVVRGARGRALVRLDAAGRELWTCQLPGYVIVRPAAFGPLLIVQTRGGSYGGQATSGVDLRTGQLLWSETVNAYGHGAAFGSDAQFVVEADLWLSPGATEGWLICRDPRTGRRRWELRRPGLTAHWPLVEAATHRVFSVLGSGVLVCVDGQSGKLLWEARMPAPVRRLPGPDPHGPLMTLHKKRLAVLDEGDVLRLFDADTGKPIASFAPVSPVTADGKAKSYSEAVAMPWFESGNLIVTSQRGISAYPESSVLSGQASLELRGRALRTQLLLKAGGTEAAAREVARMQAARPASPQTWQCQAALCHARGEVEGEVIARAWLLRRSGREADPQLDALVGLVRRIPCGPDPTAPLLHNGRIYVGARDGKLRAWDADDLTPAGELDPQVAITRELTAHEGKIVFPTENRRVHVVSPDLEPLADWPSAASRALYVSVGRDLVRCSGYVSYAETAILDLATGRFGRAERLKGTPNAPVVYKGRLHLPRPVTAGVIPKDPRRGLFEYRVIVAGSRPVAYGTGGVYEVDEELRPAKALVALPGRAVAAARHNGIIAALSEPQEAGEPLLLEAWTEGGRKLPLRYSTRRYGPKLGDAPALVPFEHGFLLVGRELVFVDPRRGAPVWRFWPGGLEPSDRAAFKGPLVHGDKVLFTHKLGGLYVFRRPRVTGAVIHL